MAGVSIQALECFKSVIAMSPRALFPCLAVLVSGHGMRAQDAPKAVPIAEAPVDLGSGGYVEKTRKGERAVSRSGMFRVTGGTAAQRGSIALFLASIRDDFEALIQDQSEEENREEIKRGSFAEAAAKNNEFDVPVNVVLVTDDDAEHQSRNVVYDLGYTTESFSLGLRIHIAQGIDKEQLQRAALTLLLYERALRGVTPGNLEDPLIIRPWLVEGLCEAMKWRTDSADRQLYEGVFRNGGGFTMDELFELREKSFKHLDGASRLSFRVLSGALVMALLEQPRGREAFRSFAGEAAKFSGEMPILLRKHFPELNLSERSLEKWWTLTLAKLVQPKLSEVLSIKDTERDLKAALRFHVSDPKLGAMNLPLSDWPKIAAFEDDVDREDAIEPAIEGLGRLSYRCFPSYRALIQEYQLILRDLAEGKVDKLAPRFQEMAEQREIRLERATQARDYLDFVEISQARTLSGEFEDYMRLKEDLKLRPRPPRNDHASKVLDVMQEVYEPRKKR